MNSSTRSPLSSMHHRSKLLPASLDTRHLASDGLVRFCYESTAFLAAVEGGEWLARRW